MFKAITNTILRTISGYILLLFLARFMGRKMISQMTFFDFIVGITVGSVTANLALGPNKQSILATSTLITLASLTVITGILRLKSFKFRKMVNSEPIVVIKNATKVFYAGLDTAGNLYVSIKDEEKVNEPEGKYGIE